MPLAVMKSPRWLILLGLFWFSVSCLMAGWVFTKGIKLDTNLYSLMPKSKESKLIDNISTELSSFGDQRLILLIRGDDDSLVHSAAFLLQKSLYRDSKIVENPQESTDSEGIIELIKNKRVNFLTENDRALITTPEIFVEQKLSRVYSINTSANLLPIEDDPFGFFSASINTLTSQFLDFEQQDGYFFLSSNTGEKIAFIALKLIEPSMTIHQQASVISEINSLVDEVKTLYPTLIIENSGTLFHSVKASQQAQIEVSTFGIASLVGIILLFISSGIGLLGLTGALLVLCVAVIVGFIFCQLIFSSVHLITLVFGMSLLGIGVDYAIHLFCVRKSQTSFKVLFHTLTISVLTTCAGFALLVEAQLLLLKQVAVFTIFGLLTVYFMTLTLLTQWPLNSKPLMKADPLFILGQVAKSYKKSVFITILLTSILSVTVLLVNYKPATGLRSLINIDQDLLSNELSINKVLALPRFNQFILVIGETQDQLLNRVSQTQKILIEMKREGKIAGMLSILDWVPTINEQKINRQTQLQALKDYLPSLYSQLGVPDLSSQIVSDLEKQTFLMPYEAKSALPEPYKRLIGNYEDGYYSIILLKGLTQSSGLQDYDFQKGVQYVDKVLGWENALQVQQTEVHRQFIIILFILFITFFIIFRQVASLSIVLIPALSVLFTSALLVLIGEPLTLFHSFSFFLILGLGIDYGVFSYTALIENEKNQVTSKAIFLSMVTTVLAFGLLCFSQTPMISGMGLTLLLGILFNALLSQIITYAFHKF